MNETEITRAIIGAATLGETCDATREKKSASPDPCFSSL